MCPHILRYLATAVIINRSRRAAMKDLVKVIQQVSLTTFHNFKHLNELFIIISINFKNVLILKLYLGIIYLP